jgi:malonate-semialdehyde dehydrogenase (acetylating) / methylmalonate-semialdehyde dehydrogenase
MAISVLVAVGNAADALCRASSSAGRAVKVGPGATRSEMGPLVTSEHRDKVASYVEARGEQQGAKVVVDGRGLKVSPGTRRASSSARASSTG